MRGDVSRCAKGHFVPNFEPFRDFRQSCGRPPKNIKHIFCFLVYRRDQSLQIPTYTQYIFWFQQWLDYLTCEREVVTDMPKFSIESLFNKILFHYQVESVAESPRFVLFSERK